MGLFEDIHLLICLIALIYLFRKVRESTESRILGIAVAGFVVFFIFYQHVWIAFLFFIIMFGYLFGGGLTAGIIEGRMTSAYMHYLKHPGGYPPGWVMGFPEPSSATKSWVHK